MTKVEELKAELREANDTYNKIDKESSDRLQELLAEAREVHNNEGWYPKVQAANKAKWAIQDRLNEAEVEEARVKHAAILGRKVSKMVDKSNSSWHRNMQPVYGIIELCTTSTVMPENVSYGLPDIGELFVRALKKDGTPGVRILGNIQHGYLIQADENGVERLGYNSNSWNSDTSKFSVAWTFV